MSIEMAAKRLPTSHEFVSLNLCVENDPTRKELDGAIYQSTTEQFFKPYEQPSEFIAENGESGDNLG